jgi:PatG C-terminal
MGAGKPEELVSRSAGANHVSPPPTGSSVEIAAASQAANTETRCPTCSGEESPSYVYALGRIHGRFPRVAVEKEFAQAAARVETKGKTDGEVFHAVMSLPENRYLARQMCWVLTIQGLETYVLRPREPADLGLLIDATKQHTDYESWLSCVIGIRGAIAPPSLCNGLMVPVMHFEQIYSFDSAALIKAIPRPEKIPAKEFLASSRELFIRVLQLTDNAGATDDHRALNYLVLRYPRIYERAAELHARDFSLTAVEARASRLSGSRKIVDVIFSYSDRKTDFTEKHFVRVDVTEEFPFLVTGLAPYFDR